MANQLKTKFIGNDQITSEKVLLDNNTALRGKDSSAATQDILKLDATDKVIVYRSTGAEEIAYMSDVNSGGTALQDHIDDISGAHAASAISVSAIANMAATDVQAALAELQGDLDGIDATYVNVSGDTMTGSLDITIGGKTLSIDEAGFAESSGGASVTFSNVSTEAIKIDGNSNDVKIVAANINLDANTKVFSPKGMNKNGTDASGISFAALSDSMTLSGQASSIVMDGEISMTPSNTVTINGSVDMQAHQISDLSQVTGLNAAAASGNALRYDELGVYSPGAGYGIATLNNAGKIPSSQLPNAIMEYQGTWDASTNTPTLADGSGANAPEDAGHVYKVSVGGTQDLGSGSITFVAGDSIILNSSLVWEKSADANLVYSVNGAQGVVVLDSEDLTYHQGNASDWTVADDSSIKLTLDEVGSRLTAGENADLTYLLLDGTRPMQGSIEMGAYAVQFNASAEEIASLNNAGLSFSYDDLGADMFYTSAISRDTLNIHQEVSSTGDNVYTMSYSAGKLSLTEGVGNDPMVATDPSHVIVKAALDAEVTAIDGRLDALEAVVYAAPYKKTLVAGDITNQYIDLPFLAVQTNGIRVCVDRLQLHQGGAEDYTLSTVGGVTRITFLNDMVEPGPQKLAAGDNIYVVYQKNA